MMPKDISNDTLLDALRELSLHIDSTAIELNRSCSCGLFSELMEMSERLSHVADAIEDPAMRDDTVDCHHGLAAEGLSLVH